MTETSTPDIEQVMTEYTDLWNGDFSKLDVVAESVAVYHDAAPSGVVHGRDALDTFIRQFHDAFPDFRLAVDDWMHTDGVAMKEWTMTGTHEGQFAGVQPTGREVESSGMAKVVIEGGKVQVDRLYYNPQLMAEQLASDE